MRQLYRPRRWARIQIMQVYSVDIDRVEEDDFNCLWGSKNGSAFQLFYACEDETDAEMIAAGYIRVECSPQTDGGSTLWAELWEINSALQLCGESPVDPCDIAA
jgi:hypothetical protein